MSILAFSLVALAGLIHSLWNIAAKQVRGDARFACFVGVVTALIWAPVACYYGADVVGAWGRAAWGVVALSGAVHLAYFMALLRAYRRADLTVVYPTVHGAGTLLSALLAAAVFRETLTALALCGIVAVAVGVFLVAGGPRLARAGGADAADSRVRYRRLRRGLGWGLLAAAFVAVFTVVDGYAVKAMLLPPILLQYFGNLVRALVLLPSVLRDRAEAAVLWRAQWRYALGIAVVAPMSYVLLMSAVRLAPLSHVAPARELSLLFTALIGGRLFAERNRRLRLLGALSIGAGMIALVQ